MSEEPVAPPITAAEIPPPEDSNVRTPLARFASWLGKRNPGYRVTRNVYLRALGLCFLCAFASFHVQQSGLIGSQGILPAHDYLKRVGESLGGPSFSELPTLLWYSSSDSALTATTLSGIAASLLLMLGFVPLLSLFLCWILYLSISLVGGVFMHFQWDALLLEAGFTSLFLCPLSWRLSRYNYEPHPIAVVLVRFLLFKLMFMSGWVKLASHDGTWRELTALNFHYWSQPLPTWTAWMMDGAPRLFHKAATVLMLAIELGSPLFLFAPRRLRLYLGFAPLFALQLIIFGTGNYGFFNLLAITLCLFGLDDLAITRKQLVPAPKTHGSLAIARGLTMAAAFIGFMTVNLGEMTTSMLGATLPSWQERFIEAIAPLRSISTYGLFASMTTDRLEIGVEGSNDGKNWLPYEFKWKPGDLNSRPAFVTPHMPRLDWQMWFAALGTCRNNGWFVLFQQRLLEGSKPVIALLARDPFPDHPPRYIRTPVYRYRFSDLRALHQRGVWWTRADLGYQYCPELTLKDGQLTPVKSQGKKSAAPIDGAAGDDSDE